jgi:hypothetical protein
MITLVISHLPFSYRSINAAEQNQKDKIVDISQSIIPKT